MSEKAIRIKQRVIEAHESFMQTAEDNFESEDFIRGAQDLFEQILFEIDMEVM